MAAQSSDLLQPSEYEQRELSADENVNMDMDEPYLEEQGNDEPISRGIAFDTIVTIRPQPPSVPDMEQIASENVTFMISPFKFDPRHPDREPLPMQCRRGYEQRGDVQCVQMPSSPHNVNRKGQSIWEGNRKALIELKRLCDGHLATVENLTKTIRNCAQDQYELGCLEQLINDVYSNEERAHFMSAVLSNICTLALDVDTVCPRPLPLLRAESNGSVTLSQRQAASLLACAFFCLFPNRSNQKYHKTFSAFPKANFNELYKSGHPKKMEKLKCIFNYFRRVTEQMPAGVITIQRFVLPNESLPLWSTLTTELCDLHLTNEKKIEDVGSVLQVDFAAKYIGGGVLGSGCVQEEIRFSICPEMLVSLLVCERMRRNECVFLIGCERYSSYRGYASTFQFDCDYVDNTPKDSWGRKWCHLVAMDAVFYRDKSQQYTLEYIERELHKAYTSFRPQRQTPEYQFGIATGNWGCGAFRGDRELKAIIQLMAASEARRPLIYAAYRDKTIVNSFGVVYEILKDQKATVGDLYRYVQGYSTRVGRCTLFEYIVNTPVSSLKS